jgi:hypothetical protein
MEFDKINGHYLNGLNEEINLENDLVFGILKSSDLKNTLINSIRKYSFEISTSNWPNYLKQIAPFQSSQIEMFA